MSESNNKNFSAKVGSSARLRMNAKKNADQGVWLGLGMMGLIGWSIVVPTLLGAALGIWLDARNSGENHRPMDWTIALIMAGLTIGCINAWAWVAKEDKAMHQENEDADE